MSPRFVCAAVGVCLLALSLPGARGGESLEKLQRQKVQAAQDTYDACLKLIALGKDVDPEHLYRWSVRLLQAQQAADPKPEANLRVLAAHLKRMKHLETTTMTRFEGGLVTLIERNAARFYRVEAETWLAEAKAKAKK